MLPYYENAYGKLYFGDCLEVIPKLQSPIGVFITSPPYNLRNSVSSWAKTKGSSRWKNAALRQGYEGHDDNMPHEEYVAWQRACVEVMFQKLDETGAIFYNHKWRVQKGLLQDRSDIIGGFPLRQILIWQRSGGFNFNDGYFVPTYEVIYLLTKKGFKLRKKANGAGDVWKINQDRGNPHPAPFPVELPEKIISSVDHQMFCDPFCGSGTTGVACMNLGRKFVLIEKEERYCEIAARRLEDALKNIEGYWGVEDL